MYLLVHHLYVFFGKKSIHPTRNLYPEKISFKSKEVQARLKQNLGGFIASPLASQSMLKFCRQKNFLTSETCLCTEKLRTFRMEYMKLWKVCVCVYLFKMLLKITHCNWLYTSITIMIHWLFIYIYYKNFLVSNSC